MTALCTRVSALSVLSALAALLGACGDGVATLSPSCATLCATQASCDAGAPGGGTDASACVERCDRVGRVVDPTYWPGVGACAVCGNNSGCIAAEAMRVPASTVEGFLRDLCGWAVTCQSGLTVDQCVALLQRVGSDPGEVRPWAYIGLLRGSVRRCLIDCYASAGCASLQTGAAACAQSCGVTDFVGDDATNASCDDLTCGDHGRCVVQQDRRHVCECDAGYRSPTGRDACVEGCQRTGCGAGGTCGADGACVCAAGYGLTARGQCARVARFTAVAVGGDVVCALRDDRRVECLYGFEGTRVSHSVLPPTDVVQLCLDQSYRTQRYCVRTMDGTVDCHSLVDPTRPPFRSAPGQVDVACGDGARCIVGRDGSTSCQDLNGANATIPSMSPPSIARMLVTSQFFCGLTGAGAVHCWSNALPPASVVATVPSQLSSGATSLAIDAGSACAVDSAGQLRCWGAMHALPTDLGAVDRVAIGGGIDCVRSAGTRALRCFGTYASGPTPPEGIPSDPVLDIAVSPGTSGRFVCIVRDEGSVQCFGAPGWPSHGTGVMPEVL
jgi:hypothetical protein